MKEFNGEKLLVLGGFNLSCDIVLRAQKMGAYVIVADYNPDVPAKQIADQFELVSATDVDALVELAQKEHVSGVTTGFVDILLQPCLDVCQRLGLPCYLTPKMIDVSTNKISFKDECNRYGVPVPQTYFIGKTIPEEVYQKINYPVFVKPLDASGSRGADICHNREELERLFAIAVGYSPTKNAIVEDYLTGREFLMNYVAQDGEFRMVSMFDRYASSDRGGALNYANLAMGPSKEVKYYLDEVESKVVNMFRSLGFKDGLFFLQGFTNGKRVTFYEMGCRLGGSYYELENKCIGIDPVNMIIRYALTGKMAEGFQNIPVRVGDYKNIGVCVNYLLAAGEETIAKINGIDEIEKMPSFVADEKRQFEGDHYVSRIADWPVLSVYLAVDDMYQLVRDVKYMNSVFSVYNKDGKSLLKEVFDPELLMSKDSK